MKTLRTLLLLSFIAASGIANAFHNSSRLMIRHEDHIPFVIEMDRHRFNASPSGYTFYDIAPGRHFVEVRKKYNRYSNGQVLYRGYVDVPALSSVNMVLLCNRTLVTESVIPLAVPHQYNNSAYCAPAPVYPVAQYCDGMEPARYNALRASIAARSFDSTRLSLAKDAVRMNRMNSKQIAGLVELLDFDSSRLSLAKYAYGNVTDPGNYFVLYDLFAFDSSVRELSGYIADLG